MPIIMLIMLVLGMGLRSCADRRLNLHANNGGKFLEKLWCCVGGSITRLSGFP